MTNKTGNASSALLDKLVEATSKNAPKPKSDLSERINKIAFSKPQTLRDVLAQMESGPTPISSSAPAHIEETAPGQESDLLSNNEGEPSELPAEARTADEVIGELEALLAELKGIVGVEEEPVEGDLATEETMPELPENTQVTPELPSATPSVPAKPMY